MKKISVFLAVMVFAGLMSSAAFGFSYKLAPDEIAGIDLSSIDKLFARAMGSYSKNIEPDPKAQYELGVLFFRMYNAANFEDLDDYDQAKYYALTYNLNQAVYWLREAAFVDYAPAQCLLGNIYYWFLHDYEAAYAWLDKAAENGYARAQALRADLHRLGHNYLKALELANKSAEQDDAFGMYVLSEIYGTESYEGHDEAKFEEWKKRAIEAAKNDPTIDLDDDDFVPVIRKKKLIKKKLIIKKKQ